MLARNRARKWTMTMRALFVQPADEGRWAQANRTHHICSNHHHRQWKVQARAPARTSISEMRRQMRSRLGRSRRRGNESTANAGGKRVANRAHAPSNAIWTQPASPFASIRRLPRNVILAHFRGMAFGNHEGTSLAPDHTALPPCEMSNVEML